MIISQIHFYRISVLLNFGQYARYASFDYNCIKLWGFQERSNDWKYVVPCKSIYKDTQMLS